MEKFLDKLVEGSIDISAKLIIAVIVLAIGSKIIKAIESNLRKENKLKHLDASVKGFLISFISITSKIVLFIVLLPFNLLLSILVSIVTFMVYKRISDLFKKELFKTRSYEMVRMFLNQFATAIFGLVLALAAGRAERVALRNVTSACAIVFYLFLLFLF